MNREAKLEVARIVLGVCASRGYHLSGSLALHVHGVRGARESDDIDLFTHKVLDADSVRAAVLAALRERGYQAEVTRTGAPHPLAQCDQNADLLVSHSQYGTVSVQMVRMDHYFEPEIVNGIPVAALGDLLYNKLEAQQKRAAAKDYVDLTALREHLGPEAVDSYISDYVTGIAQVRGVPEEDIAEQLYLRLAQAAEVPDEAFAVYGLDAVHATQTRTEMLAWGERIMPEQHNVHRMEPRLAVGLEAMTRQEAQVSLKRVAGGGQLAMLSYPQLSTVRGEAVAKAVDARRELERAAAAAAQGQELPDNLDEQMRQAQAAADEVERINQEIRRRARLTARQRAEEAAVRRAVAGEIQSTGSKSAKAQRVAEWLTATPSARRHAQAEEEWQVHRPGQAPGSQGVRR